MGEGLKEKTVASSINKNIFLNVAQMQHKCSGSQGGKTEMNKT